jgi:hypothetical protein
MIRVLILVCCVFGCPLIMGGVMWFLGRDRVAAAIDREIRRLNRVAAQSRGELPPRSWTRLPWAPWRAGRRALSKRSRDVNAESLRSKRGGAPF